MEQQEQDKYVDKGVDNSASNDGGIGGTSIQPPLLQIIVEASLDTEMLLY